MVKEYKAPTTINAFVMLINRTGIGRSQTLTTIGRKSGERREVPVSPIEVDGTTFLVAPYGEVAWVRNARSSPAVTLRSGSKVLECRLVEVTRDAAGVVAAYHQREPFPRRYMDVPENPSLADFEAASDKFPVFRVEPTT